MVSKVLIAALFVAIACLASAEDTPAPSLATVSPSSGAPPTGAPSTGAPATGAAGQSSSTLPPAVNDTTATTPASNVTVSASVETTTKSAHGVTVLLSLVPIAISMLI